MENDKEFPPQVATILEFRPRGSSVVLTNKDGSIDIIPFIKNMDSQELSQLAQFLGTDPNEERRCASISNLLELCKSLASK